MVARSKTSTAQTKRWWLQGRREAVITAVLAIIVAYIIASRAIDTGSLGQYGVVIVLVGLFFNRLGMAVHPKA